MTDPGDCCKQMIKLNLSNRLTDWLAIILSCGGCARVWTWDCRITPENPIVIEDLEWVEVGQ